MTPSAQQVDTDDERLRVQEAGAALVTAKRESHPKRKKTGGREEDVPARAQTELDKAMLFLAVILMSTGSTCSSKQSCRFLSANVSTCRPEAEFLRDTDRDSRSKKWNSQNFTMEWRAQLVGLRNSILCHGVHDLVKMCHLVNLVRSNNWAYVCV